MYTQEDMIEDGKSDYIYHLQLQEGIYPASMEAFGWNFDKNPDDFLVIADMLEKEGKESRSKAIRYLVARLKEAEKIARGK